MNSATRISQNGEPTAPRPETAEDRIAQALEEYAVAIETGKPCAKDELLTRYVDVADELAGCLDSLEFIHQVAPQLNDGEMSTMDESPIRPLATLGDFRIVREIGRGGMGVVYEAEQLSLGRRVALKVLPFAAVLDKQQQKRFKNEARAAATLDHPNIVSVFSVGADRGVHYYAMQLIEGQSLAEVIAKKGARRQGAGNGDESPVIETANFNRASQVRNPKSEVDTAVAALSTIPDSGTQEYFRTIARLGIQAAEALDHAHELGVIHRDVKPANLLVDASGKLWVTDFGLARLESDAGMTMTGDLIGTLRYMSPEQALAKRVVVDHRTDIYSLGVTLYELLAGRPAYDTDDRQELLRRIAFEEPRRLRQVNRRIPEDLETIVAKAMEKSPEERFSTAAELSCDLQRFLHGTSIRTQRPSTFHHARKWIYRHRTLSVTVFACLILTAISGVGGLLYAYQAEVRRLRDIAIVELRRAEERELTYRHALYASDLNLAEDAWQIGELARMKEILLRHKPSASAPDIRGWEWQYLWSQADRSLLNRWRAHDGPIHHATLSPKRDLLATVSQDGTAKIWDFARRKLLATFHEHDGEVNSIAFTLDGSRVVTAGDDGTLRIWDPLSGKPHRVVQAFRGLGPHGFQDIANQVVYSQDGALLAAASRVETRIYDALSLKLLKTLPGSGPQFAPDGELLVTLEEGITGQGRVHLWTLPALEPHGEPWPTDELRNATFSPDSSLLVVCQRGGELRIFNVATGESRQFRAFASEAVWSSFSPDGNVLAVASHDGQVRLFDPVSGVPMSVAVRHGNRTYCVFFSADSSRLVTLASDPDVCEWDVRALIAPACLRFGRTEPVFAAAYTPTGDVVAAESTYIRECVPLLEEEHRILDCQTYKPTTLSISACGRWLASGESATTSIWDLRIGEQIASIESGATPGFHYRHHLAFAPHRDTLAIAADSQVLMVDPATGKPRGSIEPPENRDHICVVEYSKDGESIIFGDTAGRVWIYDSQRNECLHKFRTTVSGHITDLALTPQGDVLVAASQAGSVVVWSLDRGRERFTLLGHTGPVEAVAISPDGRSLASAGVDGTIRFWSLANGREQITLPVPQPATLYDVTFSPDGKRLLASGVSRGESAVFEWRAE